MPFRAAHNRNALGLHHGGAPFWHVCTGATENSTSHLRGACANEVVLVVEDEPVVRLLIVEALNDFCYKALEAVDSAAALRILQSSQRIDLLVNDIGLLGLNGRQLEDAARVKRPNSKVLFVAGYAENAAGSSFLEPAWR
jgi:CheY-like chemotaxis protein